MNSKRFKLQSIAIVMLLFVSAFSFVFADTAVSSPIYVEPKAIDEDVKTAALDLSEPYEAPEITHHSYWNIGDLATWTVYRSGVGLYLSTHQLCYIGTDVEIWVQYNINFPSGQTPDRNSPTKPTYAMLQYLADQFEDNILLKESDFFGAPLFHDGSNANLDDLLGLPPDYYYEPSGRVVILVQNIRDANYYDPGYPIYVIGVHIGDYESFYYDRNTVTLDAVSWYHGLGPATMNWGDHLSIVGGVPTIHNHDVTAPYAYDSALAHEFQHLLHYELCPGDEIWMNEGCSMYAELLCGYGIDSDYPNSYFATPDNSLTEWGDQGDINILADYGAAALWTTYLSDQFGAEFLQYYFSSGGGGIDGISAALAHFGYRETFESVYHDWRLANLIRADFPGCHRYNYKSLNLNDPVYIPVRMYEISGLPVPWTKGTDFGNTVTFLGDDTGIAMVGSYGTDYIMFNDWNKLGFIFFDGDDKAQELVKWTLTDFGWYSGQADLLNTLLYGSAYVDPANPTLDITTYWDMEDYWDFGFIQVSTDGGETWTSLENEYTTYDVNEAAHPDIISNLPGLTSWSYFVFGDVDFHTISFDLTPYAGQIVTIGFRYMTDWATTYEGWYISEATVSDIPVELTVYTPDWEADFMVTAVYAFVTKDRTFYLPMDMWLCDRTEKGTVLGLWKPNYVVLIVSSKSQHGWVDYAFKATPLRFSCR